MIHYVMNTTRISAILCPCAARIELKKYGDFARLERSTQMTGFVGKIILLGLLLCLVSCQSLQKRKTWRLNSPDGNISITVVLADLGAQAHYPAGQKRLYYQIENKVAGQLQVVLPFSPLGISRDDQDFIDGLLFESKDDVVTIDETYTLRHGKRRQCHNHANEMTLNFNNGHGANLQLIFRAYDDGIAFRYRFPDTDTNTFTVTGEMTGFRLPPNGVAYMQPYQEAGQWTPAYEDYYQKDLPIGTPSPNNAGWAFPALFKTGVHWVLLTEAGLDESYCGTRLAREAPDAVYHIRLPDKNEGYGIGAVLPSSTLPWSTPWRVVMVGTRLATIVESSLVTHLNPPAMITDGDWIKPGRVSWSWWSESDSPKDFNTLCEFVDLAADLSWDYSLVDANWDEMGEDKIRELVNYARDREVGILLWYNSGGSHNIVTEKPRDRMHEKGVRRREFQFLRDLGVKGVKVDFFQSDKQNIIQHYLSILQDAADYQIMVNFHGCTLPRGWSRTYPHLMTMEAVKGAECYKFDNNYPENSPWHNTILVFTRNVVGPMDYTPVTFTDHQYPHLTTYVHELALAVVFESGWVHFADRVSAYRNLPQTPANFLRQIPAAWNDIRLLDGEPGKLAVVARQKDNDWFIGGINGSDSTTVTINFSFLDNNSYQMVFIGDGATDDSFNDETATVTADDSWTVTMRTNGGFVMHLTPTGK